MTTHWNVTFGSRFHLCGTPRTGDLDGRCLDARCDRCEGDRDKVNCVRCVERAGEILGNLAYFFRADGPHFGADAPSASALAVAKAGGAV